MNKLIIALFSICCLLAVVPPRQALAAPPDDAPVRAVTLEVDISTVGGHAQGLDNVIRNTLTPELEKANFEVRADAPLILRVRLRTLESGPRDYGVHFELVEDGAVDAAIEWMDCHFCADARLLPLLEAKAPALIEALEKRVAAPDVEASTPEGNPPENGHDDPPEIKPVKPIGLLGISGAIGLGVGIGLSIGGGAVLANPKQQKIQDEAILGIERNRTPLGVSLLVPGAALVVAGTVMLAVDLSKRAKQRKHAQNITVVPTLSPSSAGLGVVGRF